MKRFILLLAGLLVAGVAWAQAPQAEKAKKFPENKWFNGVDGLEEAKELQKQFDADILVYFARYSPNDQKGLCNWWEKRGLAQQPVQKLLRDYLKVKIELPLNKKDTEAIAPFNVNKCPALFIIQPDGKRGRFQVFDWPGGEPKVLSPDQIIANIREKSSAKYQVTEQD